MNRGVDLEEHQQLADKLAELQETLATLTN